MRIGIMQPYLFPYLGYFQLIQSVDRFVFYDDVAFIKQGWINRNSILLDGKPHLFTVPVKSISSYEKINATRIAYNLNWNEKLLRTFQSAYIKSPYYSSVMPLLEQVLLTRYSFVADLAVASVRKTCEYIGMSRQFVDSSSIYSNSHLKSEARIIDIVLKEKCSNYINMAGGKELYSKQHFGLENIQLNFLSPVITEYKQFNNEFVPSLSIIDLLMFNSPGEIREMLTKYTID